MFYSDIINISESKSVNHLFSSAWYWDYTLRPSLWLQKKAIFVSHKNVKLPYRKDNAYTDYLKDFSLLPKMLSFTVWTVF